MAGKFFIDKNGNLKEYRVVITERGIRFPVCLAIRRGEQVTEECPDFLLDLQRAEVSVRTPHPLPKGTGVTLHFYIPPETKFLAETRAVVAAVRGSSHEDGPGMLLSLAHDNRAEMLHLESYLEEKVHLVDEIV